MLEDEISAGHVCPTDRCIAQLHGGLPAQKDEGRGRIDITHSKAAKRQKQEDRSGRIIRDKIVMWTRRKTKRQDSRMRSMYRRNGSGAGVCMRTA